MYHTDSRTAEHFVRWRYPWVYFYLRTDTEKRQDTRTNLLRALNHRPPTNDPLVALTRLLEQDDPFKPSC
jgi:hypothetical protein